MLSHVLIFFLVPLLFSICLFVPCLLFKGKKELWRGRVETVAFLSVREDMVITTFFCCFVCIDHIHIDSAFLLGANILAHHHHPSLPIPAFVPVGLRDKVLLF